MQKNNNSWLLGNGTDTEQEHGASTVPSAGLTVSPSAPVLPGLTQLCTQRA